MRSELLAPTAATGRDAGPGEAGPPSTVSEAFEPYPTSGLSAADPGARHAAWTLATMIRSPVRDLMALAAGPLDVVLVGATEGWLALQLLAWGCGTVTVVDRRSDRRERVLQLAEVTASDPGGGALRTVAEIGEAPPGRLDLAVLDARRGGQGADPSSIAALADRDASILLLTDDRRAAGQALRSAGRESIGLLQPPADAERRFVKLEVAVLEARPAGGGR